MIHRIVAEELELLASAKELLAQRRELDPEKRKRIVHDIQRYVADKAYYVYIPIGLSYHVHQPYLKGFAPKIGHTMVHRVIAAWLDK